MKFTRYLGLVVLLFLAVSGFAADKKAPEGDFQLPACPPDWKVEPVASAPKVINPSVICCAPDGRIFVGEDPMDMGKPAGTPSDRVLCIHTNGTITVFATNLYAVYGLQYIDGKVYVHHTPKFSVFDDNNGVGTNRIDLIESDNPHPWLPTFNDHIPSNFKLGLDGYLYVSTGDKGIYGAVGKDGKRLEIHGGGIFRMRPNGTELEAYSTGTRNHLDVALNAEDEMFTMDNTDDGQGWWTRVTHMVDSGFYGYPYDYKPQQPYTLWMMSDYGGGAPTGGTSYNEDALPEEYRGNLFMCDWGKAAVMRFKVERSGGSYKINSREKHGKDFDFLNKKPEDTFPSYFTPVGITTIPDGTGFYVTDWFWVGWQNHSGENNINEGVGRVLKVTYTGPMKPAPKPEWFVPAGTGKKFKASTKDLVKGLSHPAQSVRLVAQRRLADRKFDGYSRIVSLLKDTKAPAYARWSAIWTLDSIDGGKKARSTIVTMLKDKDASVRMQAARQLGTRRAKEAVPSLVTMLSDTNAAIVFRAATALGRIGDASATKPLIAALEQTDLFARYAVFTALNRIGIADGKAWQEIVKNLANEKPAVREGVGFVLRETYNTNLISALAHASSDQTLSVSVRTNVIGILARMYRKPPEWNGDWWSTGPASSPAPAHSADWAGTIPVASAMRDATKNSEASIRLVALEWIKSSRDTASIPQLHEMFNAETNSDMKKTIVQALGELNDPSSSALIESILNDPKADEPLLNAAIEAAGKINTTNLKSALVKAAERELPHSTLIQLLQSFAVSRLTNAAPVVAKHLNHADKLIRDQAQASLVQIGGDAAATEFLSVLTNNSDIERRRAAAKALGNLKAKSAIPALVDASTNPSTRDDATAALTQMADVRGLDAFLFGLNSKTAVLRTQCEHAIEAIRDNALSAIEAKLAKSEIPSDVIGTLQKIYSSNNSALKGPLFKIRATQLAAKDYEVFALKNSGNKDLGKKIFFDPNGVACSRCHRINGEGGEMGPDLSDVGTKYGTTAIIDAILNPSKQILDGFQVTQFELKNGEEISGAVRAETADGITLMDGMGQKRFISKTDISKRKASKVSLMPEELQSGLSLLEFSDLVTFVSGSARPKIVTSTVVSVAQTNVSVTRTNHCTGDSNVGAALRKEGKIKEAKEAYLTYLKDNRDCADAHYNLGNVLSELGEDQDAVFQFKEALSCDPKLADAHNNLAILFNKLGNKADSEKHFIEALRLNPNAAQTHANFGSLLMAQHRSAEAITQYNEALRVKTNEADWHFVLARLLTAEKPEEAVSHFQEALRLQPDSATMHTTFAWLLATYPKAQIRNGQRAIELASRACELTKEFDVKALDALGAAYAEAGRFNEALTSANKAYSVASTSKKELMSGIQERIELYKKHKPFHLEAPAPTQQTNSPLKLTSVKITPVTVTYNNSSNAPPPSLPPSFKNRRPPLPPPPPLPTREPRTNTLVPLQPSVTNGADVPSGK